MSDNEGTKAKGGWTDRELLVYLFALVEHSGVKFDYNTTPRPAGRTVRACQTRIDRLKGTLKDDLEALKNGQALEEGTPKKGTSTPRKRKGKDAETNGDAEASPAKRGRKKKAISEPQVDDDEDSLNVKAENVEDDA